MTLYFCKSADGDIVSDSSIGFDTFAEAQEVVRQSESFSVIEERLDADSGNPLSGELVASYAV